MIMFQPEEKQHPDSKTKIKFSDQTIWKSPDLLSNQANQIRFNWSLSAINTSCRNEKRPANQVSLSYGWGYASTEQESQNAS